MVKLLVFITMNWEGFTNPVVGLFMYWHVCHSVSLYGTWTSSIIIIMLQLCDLHNGILCNYGFTILLYSVHCCMQV